MRYIDADALEPDTEWSDYHDGFTAYSQLQIDTAPSIDIVRCKECWHGKQIECEDGVFTYFCDISDLKWRADDFCSYGERRE